MLAISAFANASLITGTFAGGDVGEGLDFTGDFEYAVNALEFLMHSIRWSSAGNLFDIVLSDLSIGNNYSLQLLFGEKCCNRRFDIFADSKLIKDNFSANGLQCSSFTTVGAFVRIRFHGYWFNFNNNVWWFR